MLFFPIEILSTSKNCTAELKKKSNIQHDKVIVINKLVGLSGMKEFGEN